MHNVDYNRLVDADSKPAAHKLLIGVESLDVGPQVADIQGWVGLIPFRVGDWGMLYRMFIIPPPAHTQPSTHTLE